MLTTSRFIAAIDDDTDFTVTVGDGAYSWRIHAELAAKHSTFFKTMIEGPETVSSPASSQSTQCQELDGTDATSTHANQQTRIQAVDLQEDNSWMVARMLQFFYQGTFDYGHKSTRARTGFDSPISEDRRGPQVSLEKIMSRVQCSKEETFTRRKNIDSRLTKFEVATAMYVLGDKYGAPDLKTYALNNLKRHNPSAKTIAKVCQGSFRQLIDKDTELKLAIAHRIAHCYGNLRAKENEWLQNWIKSDPGFALLIMDDMNQSKQSKQSTASPFTAMKSTAIFASPAHSGFGFGGQPTQSTTPKGPFRGFGGAAPVFGAPASTSSSEG